MQPRIINGAVDYEHEAVVALTYYGQQFCSGTLVASRTVVTAAHCLTDFSVSDIQVFFGLSVGGSGQSVNVVQMVSHPSYYVASNGGGINDVAVLVLAQDGPVPPLSWQSSALGNVVGRSVTIVGYGVTDAKQETGNGTRRMITKHVTGQDNGFLYYNGAGSSACYGDSGGPVLLDVGGALTLVGVTSSVEYPFCAARDVNTRVDKYADFVSQYLTGAGPGPGPAPVRPSPSPRSSPVASR